MKFILKDGFVYMVGNHGIPNNKVEGTIEIPGLEGYLLDVKINNAAYKRVENLAFFISEEELKKPTLSLTFRAIKGEDILYFKTDALPLTHLVLLGEPLEAIYPQALLELRHQVKTLIDMVKDTNKGLKHTMLELVDTFEDITRKGSLF